MKSPSTHEYNLYMQTDVVDHIACPRDTSSNLSDFVDSLLASDCSTYVFNCNIDAFPACSFNDANECLDSRTQGDAASPKEAGIQSTIVSPACSSVQAPKSKQRTSFNILKNRKGRNHICIKGGRHGFSKFVRRTITNKTYLRRLYFSPEQASCLFAGIKFDLTPFIPSRKRRTLLKSKEVNYDVELTTCDGQRWTSGFECAVSTNGQLHCRLVKGWSQFCRDNGVAAHDSVVFEPSTSNPNEIVARIERESG